MKIETTIYTLLNYSLLQAILLALDCFWNWYGFKMSLYDFTLDSLSVETSGAVWFFKIWQGNCSCNYIYLLQLVASGPSLRLPKHTGFSRVKTKWTIILSNQGLENKIVVHVYKQTSREISLYFRSIDHSGLEMVITVCANRHSS